jgi:hypothetical protein
MEVFVVLADYGVFDGGSSIIGIFASRQDANKKLEEKVAIYQGYPSVMIEPYILQQ